MEDINATPREYVVEKIEKYNEQYKVNKFIGSLSITLISLLSLMLVWDTMKYDNLTTAWNILEFKFGFVVNAINYILSVTRGISIKMRIDQLQTSLDLDELAKKGR